MNLEAELVAMLKTCIPNQKVYHIKNIAGLNANSAFPYIVYKLDTDVPLLELDGNSNWFDASFRIYICSFNPSDLKTIARNITNLTGNFQTQFGYLLTIQDDSEDIDIPTELQELQITNVLNVTIEILRKDK